MVDIVLLSQGRTQQPQQHCWLESRNQAAVGASLLVNYAVGPINSVNGEPPDLQVGLRSSLVGLYGIADSAYSGGTTGTADDQFSLSSLTDFAILAVVDFSGSAGVLTSICGSDQSGNRQFQLRFSSANNLEFIRFNTSGTAFTASCAAASRKGVVLATSIGGAVSVHFASVSGTTTITGTPKAADRISLGAGFGFDPPAHSSSRLFMAAVLNGTQAKLCARSLLDNPWQLFRSSNTLLSIDAASPGASVSAAANIVEAADSASGTAAIAVAGAASISELPDSAAGAGLALISATAGVAEGADSCAGAAAVLVAATGTATESADVLSAAAVVSSGVVASSAIFEAPDTAVGVGAVQVSGAGFAQELPDSLVASAPIIVFATASVQEAPDTLQSFAVVDDDDNDGGAVTLVESQILLVDAENRIYMMPAESRTLIVTAENRILEL